MLCTERQSRDRWRHFNGIASCFYRRCTPNKWLAPREVSDERGAAEIEESAVAQRAHEGAPATYVGAAAFVASGEFQGSESGIFGGARATRGEALPAMRQTRLRE